MDGPRVVEMHTGDGGPHWAGCTCPTCFELSALRKRVEELEAAGREYVEKTDPLLFCNEDFTCGQCRGCFKARAEKAERERDDAKQYAEEYKKAYLAQLDELKPHIAKLQADLDAARRLLLRARGALLGTQLGVEIELLLEERRQRG